jgi:hypothetical protein
MVMALALLLFRYGANRGGNGGGGTTTPTPTPKIETSEWHDYFDRKIEGDNYIWIQEGDWDYPRERWTTAPGLDGSEVDGALVVKGATPGFTKKAFDNFVARFTVSFLQGTQAGWLLRAGNGTGGPSGYKFVLEKTTRPGGGFYLNATTVGAPTRRMSPPTCHVAISEYGAPGDYIKVEVTAMKNVFKYKFTLMNPNAPTDTRDVIKHPVTVGCDDIKDEGEGFLSAGRVGFFAEDANAFKVEQLAVEPKGAEHKDSP